MTIYKTQIAGTFYSLRIKCPIIYRSLFVVLDLSLANFYKSSFKYLIQIEIYIYIYVCVCVCVCVSVCDHDVPVAWFSLTKIRHSSH